MLKAALSHFVAQRDRALTNLNNLLSNPSGVGEHTDLVGEVITLVEEIEKNSSCVTMLSNLTAPPQNTENPGE
jgi:hypothetical protein